LTSNTRSSTRPRPHRAQPSNIPRRRATSNTGGYGRCGATGSTSTWRWRNRCRPLGTRRPSPSCRACRRRRRPTLSRRR
jgi:hypothetical protein